MFKEKLKFSVFKGTYYSISFVSNFKSSTTMTSTVVIQIEVELSRW